VIDPFAIKVYSEVHLGEMYRVDLALMFDLDARRTLLVELERAALRVFTKKGRPTKEHTHAVQQVEDWLRWWLEHPGDVPTGFDASAPLEGLVVMGRNRGMSDDERRRLVHLNSARRVKLITYDDLLARLRTMISRIAAPEQP
jgi:hypothetical protein